MYKEKVEYGKSVAKKEYIWYYLPIVIGNVTVVIYCYFFKQQYIIDKVITLVTTNNSQSYEGEVILE